MEPRERRQKDSPSAEDVAPFRRVEAFLRFVEAAEGVGTVPRATLSAGAAARLLGGAARLEPLSGQRGRAGG